MRWDLVVGVFAVWALLAALAWFLYEFRHAAEDDLAFAREAMADERQRLDAEWRRLRDRLRRHASYYRDDLVTTESDWVELEDGHLERTAPDGHLQTVRPAANRYANVTPLRREVGQ